MPFLLPGLPSYVKSPAPAIPVTIVKKKTGNYHAYHIDECVADQLCGRGKGRGKIAHGYAERLYR